MTQPNPPLFNWSPPVRIILFPLTKRIGKIRHTAQKLAGKRGDDADIYWRQVIAANRKHLARVGLDDAAIETELLAFHDAVQAEMVRQSYRQSSTPGGSA